MYILEEKLSQNFQIIKIFSSTSSLCDYANYVLELDGTCGEVQVFLQDDFLQIFKSVVIKNLPSSVISITLTVHKVEAHSWELIEFNNGSGLDVLDEFGFEAFDKCPYQHFKKNIPERQSC